MDAKKIIADFQLAANRVSKFQLETRLIESKNTQANVNFDIDFNVLNIQEEQDRLIGFLEFTVLIKAKIKNSILFKIELAMEGIFLGNPNKLNRDDFENMLKLNGVATLSHLSRSYLLSVSSLSGINPPIKLPMINVHSLNELKKKTDEEKELS